MACLINAKNIRLNREDIRLAKLDGVIVYEKINPNEFYVEYKVNDIGASGSNGIALPGFSFNGKYIGFDIYKSFDSSENIKYFEFLRKIEITLKTGEVINKIEPNCKCNEVSNIKLWYPKFVERIGFNDHSDEMISNFVIKSVDYCDTRLLTSMAGMFNWCYELTSVYLSNFDTSNVTNMRGMFDYCHKLTSLDLSNFDTSKVTDMEHMFNECYELTSLDLSSFDTSNVTSMSDMFNKCYGLISLDLSSFDTSKVTDMSYMFHSCGYLTELDLSGFNTDNVTNTNYMIAYCDELHTLRLDNCNNSTINTIITSTDFPVNAIEGKTRKIYVNPNNIGDLTPPENWVFVNCETNEVIN